MEEEKRISEEELKKDVAAAEARIRKTDDFTSCLLYTSPSPRD